MGSPSSYGIWDEVDARMRLTAGKQGDAVPYRGSEPASRHW